MVYEATIKNNVHAVKKSSWGRLGKALAITFSNLIIFVVVHLNIAWAASFIDNGMELS